MMSSLLAHEAQQALKLLDGYSFELGWYDAESQIVKWLQTYRATWIRDAIVEALYQGRYKAVSVQQILALWNRRGQPVRHFTPEFEQMVGRPVGVQLAPLTASTASSSSAPQIPDNQHPDGSERADSTTPSPQARAESMGVLYALHQPIQPFQPELPLRQAGRHRSKPVGFGQPSR
jgi:hypothetical protein